MDQREETRGTGKRPGPWQWIKRAAIALATAFVVFLLVRAFTAAPAGKLPAQTPAAGDGWAERSADMEERLEAEAPPAAVPAEPGAYPADPTGLWLWEPGEEGGAVIRRYLGEEREPLIPAQLEGRPVTAIGDAAFRDCDSLVSAVIPEGVETIGNSAFMGCGSLERVVIPGTVTRIGANAFRRCTSLVSVRIPGSVESIGEWAFFGCGRLRGAFMGEGLTAIGAFAFAGCGELREVSLPASLARVGESAFHLWHLTEYRPNTAITVAAPRDSYARWYAEGYHMTCVEPDRP